MFVARCLVPVLVLFIWGIIRFQCQANGAEFGSCKLCRKPHRHQDI